MSIRAKSIIPKQKTTKQRTGASKSDTIISLQQTNLKLQKQVVLLQQKILKLDKQNFKQKQIILKLQAKNLKPKNKFKSIEEMKELHSQIAAIKAMKHDEPPEK